MAGYDWGYIADRGGEAVEGLVATFLVREYPGARQVNPSQGDNGVDVLLETPNGLEIWQIKKFLTPLTSGQWNQVKRSWRRFRESHGSKVIARYHLVTLWTPTRERYAQFDELTADVDFPTQWDGEAYVNGLADKYPASLARFQRGPTVFEDMINAKAILAQSPVETADNIQMLDAVEIRERALEDVRDQMSDTYRIDTSTRTVPGSSVSGVPLPYPDDPGLFHRITYLGDDRWRILSVVPRGEYAAVEDPIELETVFKVEEGSAKHRELIEWAEWGTPFTDVPARTVTHGGPFDGETSDTALLSFVAISQDFPPLTFVLRDELGTETARLPLTDLVRTRGAQSGWLRLVTETPRRTLRLELRSRSGDDFEFSGTVGDIDGIDPSVVLDEIGKLTAFRPSATYSIETPDGGKVIQGTGTGAPPALASYYEPIARALESLQASTTQPLLMPDVAQVTEGQLQALNRYASLYAGEAERWTWTRLQLVVPNESEEGGQLLSMVRNAVTGRGKILRLEQPVITLGNREYLIERPIASTLLTCRLEGNATASDLQLGDDFALVPDDDDTVVTAAVADWTPGSIDIFAGAI